MERLKKRILLERNKHMAIRCSRNNLFFTAVMVSLLLIVTEGASIFGLLVLKRWKGLEYAPREDRVKKIVGEVQTAVLKYFEVNRYSRFRFDADLGWAMHREYHAPKENIFNGIRDVRPHGKSKTGRVIRILAFGDSFTYCDGSPDNSTWPYFLNQTGILEVLNFGVPGYGLDQAFLRYLKEGAQYQADIVFIGYMPENIGRHLNTFRPFYNNLEWPFTKPRFVESAHGLKLIQNFLRNESDIGKFLREPDVLISQIGASDFYYRNWYAKGRWDFLATVRLSKILWSSYLGKFDGLVGGDGSYITHSEAFRVTTGIIDLFVAEVIENGALPVVVVLPDESDLQAQRLGRPKRYEPLLEYFRIKGYRYIDAQDAFSKYYRHFDMKWLVKVHYSPIGNEAVTRAILEYLPTVAKDIRGGVSGRRKK